MKKIFASINVVVIFGLLLFISCASQKNSNAGNSPSSFGALINDQRYTFVAQTVIPTEEAGRLNPRYLLPQGSDLYQLTSRYDLKITPDSVIAYLPFFGRAFTAPMDPTKGGFQFISTKFDYQKTIRKNLYQITISPKDAYDVRRIYLSIGPSGYASVQIQSINRTPISFNGVIEKN